MFRSLLLCAVLVPLFGCGDDAQVSPDSGDPTKVTYADSLNVDLASMTLLPSGVYVHDDPVGTGTEAVSLKRVQVHYTGYLPDGSRFDTSRGGAPISFNLGAGEVIKGWDEGIVGMKVGGSRRLIIPASLAYGEDGVPGVIPPYSVLIFDTELMYVR
ncbi:FKBP-type peptidyl-prolyl cis-trans isomerase [Pyxidicoccus parkwayensis]|uniref:Peptidyl-prolyl cis-trans isomerase n=1 Tax=Pyxidicoccus parkwayensis TaxID=2813578 RepID=A0ABX7P5A5_9BACT|nr:FKBP-type peptidyl-prolyl cis-trans isomerase [Pyxidicoccus parkwaysis]QSQ25670.1 FKBP-type peptidyl-prolyl cis-trans isomerase [Pyxidicoccus parkwaysis]